MSEEEYVKICKMTYDSYDTLPIDREAYFHIADVNKSYNIGTIDVIKTKLIYYAHKVRFLLQKNEYERKQQVKQDRSKQRDRNNTCCWVTYSRS